MLYSQDSRCGTPSFALLQFFNPFNNLNCSAWELAHWRRVTEKRHLFHTKHMSVRDRDTCMAIINEPLIHQLRLYWPPFRTTDLYTPLKLYVYPLNRLYVLILDPFWVSLSFSLWLSPLHCYATFSTLLYTFDSGYTASFDSVYDFLFFWFLVYDFLYKVSCNLICYVFFRKSVFVYILVLMQFIT
jgi:hypothetical protein